LISGAIFGDNLSIISDTTIASTRSQGAKMKDKFKVNFKFAIPAALICLVIFASQDISIDSVAANNSNILGLLPYLIILLLALLGINVFVVLIVGIISAALFGLLMQDYQLSMWVSDINKGFSKVQDIFILAMLIGGLSELIKRQGGLDTLTRGVKKLASKLFPNNDKRAAGFGIASLAFTSNFFTANNTVSIIITGDTAKNLATDGDIKAAQSASLLDIYACINQGLIPYGAQALLLGASLNISPVEVVSSAYYPMILLVVASIAFWRLTSR
jgi:Na+/H+ antiporter NhaC